MPRNYRFEVTLQDVDYTSRIKLVSLTDKILTAAGQDADALGFGVEELNRGACTWVLSRFALQMSRMPRMGERLTITTWVNEYGRMLTTRNFTVTASDGEEIGAAVSAWVMLDIEKRVPVDLSRLENAVKSTEEIPSPIEGPRRLRAAEMQTTRLHEVVYSDIDFNGHVGTMRYIEMMVDSLPYSVIENIEALRFDINFLHETQAGKTIAIGMSKEDGQYGFRLAADSEDICRAALKIA